MVSKVRDCNSTSVKLSCESNIFLLSWKYEIDENWSLNYHTTHKKYITYYKHGDSATVTYCAFGGDYDLYNRSTRQAVGKIVKKFAETGLITNIERPVHHRFARSAENIAIVSESLAEDPNVSVPRRS